MSIFRAATLLALVASLGGNAFFALALGRRSAPPAVDPDEEAPAATPGPASAATPAVRPPTGGQAPPAGATAAPGAGPVTLQQAQCAARLTSLEETMAQKSEALRGVLPPEPLFARGQPNPDAERLMAPIVAQVVAGGGATEKKPLLECKDVACKLTFTAPASIDDDAWDHALASSEAFAAWSQQFTLGPATPAGEAGTKQLVQRSLFFKLNGPRAVAAAQAALERGGR